LTIFYRELVASNATQFLTETAVTPFFRHHPRALYPGRITTHVLAMSALELRHPVIFRVRVKAGDFAVHGRMDNTIYFCLEVMGDPIHIWHWYDGLPRARSKVS
jgi:hypothetical protein